MPITHGLHCLFLCISSWLEPSSRAVPRSSPCSPQRAVFSPSLEPDSGPYGLVFAHLKATGPPLAVHTQVL
ncbi:hypothetical protein EJ04DRAFT_509631 [Polyplosphaeria fusca]|uniref:Uncharacterized protein n=1 Tax=Polyplosphaeria fusca TaxID=682080 RepID=A0A9P4R335_9PLEO|nr:hypothetical protein EJ04DRAFT_509631 [Polyplosphaeria fusca]